MVGRIICLLALILGLAGSVPAAVIVYEGFDYAAGSLGGRAGGTGWDSGTAWDGGQTVTAGGLEYPGLPVVGNKVASGSSNSFRLMPAGFIAANRTIWISFLCINSATPSWSGISPFAGGSEALFIGKPDTSATWGLALYNAQSDSGATTGSQLSTTPVGEQVFFVVRIVNGASSGQITAWLNPSLDREPTVDTAFYDNKAAGHTVGRVLFDRIRISGAGAVFYDELRVGDRYTDVSGGASVGLAGKPSPADESEDVPLDSALSWTPGEFAVAHDVYIGTRLADVNDASRSNPQGLLVSQDQTDAGYDMDGLLAFGQTYYWRIDEVNAAPDNTIYKGKVWSFTAEPYAYPIPSVTATASASQSGMGPENTIGGVGLDADDQHSTDGKQMWMAGTLPSWIQYAFDRVYRLTELWVWNSNQSLEAYLGFGAKDVKIEYSVDGETWMELSEVPEFTQATGVETYLANTIVDFGVAEARYVRLTILDNWGAVPQTGLSEVRFFAAPVQAREPQPAVAATGVRIDTDLDWRPGRGATSHEVHIGADANSVRDGIVPAGTVTDHGYTPASLTFATEYFWRVDEVGETGTYPGDIWSFTTQDYAPIDDFESYTDDIEAEETVWHAWIDGYGDQSSGSIAGNIDAPFAEQTVVHSGTQSLPLTYNNTKAPYYSEAERTFDTPQNWTANGATTVSLHFQGAAPSFVQTASGNILMNAIGSDIWDVADQFRFVYKNLAGNGSIVARVHSIYATNTWAKAGVMIRQNTDSGSVHAFMPLTANNDGAAGNGASFQRRLTVAGVSTNDDSATVIAKPYWVKVERVGDAFSGYISPDGIAWTQLGAAQTIAMNGSTLIGLALCSHSTTAVTGAEFSDVKTTGNVTGDWQVAEIGATQQEGNSAEGLYLTVKDNTGKTATLVNPDPVATARIGWQQWLIPLTDLTSAGLKTTAVKSITIGVGNRTSPTTGGTGKIYIDDIGYGCPLP
ncbi:MAG: discoidin domain-containing protein [Phycisphaerales bacterium]